MQVGGSECGVRSAEFGVPVSRVLTAPEILESWDLTERLSQGPIP